MHSNFSVKCSLLANILSCVGFTFARAGKKGKEQRMSEYFQIMDMAYIFLGYAFYCRNDIICRINYNQYRI